MNVLFPIADEPAAAPAGGGQSGWTCPQCGEQVEAEFEVCWSCGTSREGAIDPVFAREAAAAAEDQMLSTEPVEPPSQEDDRGYFPLRVELTPPRAGVNPYASPKSAPKQVSAGIAAGGLDTTEGDATARRAWRAAVLGIFLCPPLLSFYSGWILLQLAMSDLPLSRRGSLMFYAALVLDVVTAALAGLVASRL